jgi:hypothetical protein
MFRAVIIPVVLALSTLPVDAQTLFMPGTPEVDQLASLYQQAGRVFPVSSYPVSKAELSLNADRLEQTAPMDLCSALQSYRTRVLRFDPSKDRISASASASFESYYRTQNVSMDPGRSASEQFLDLRRLFLDRAPLGSIQLDYARDERLELAINATIQREYFLEPFSVTNLWESAAGNPFALENQDIMRGIAWYDFKPLQVELGRERVQMGPTEHSLLPSSLIPFLDALRLRLPLGRLTGDLLVATLENRAGLDDPISSVTLLAVHRYEYAFDTVRLGISGQAIYSRANNSFTLADIFPVFSWHNASIVPNNMTLVADASWVPLPGLFINGQAGVDDINVTGIGVADSSVPTIPAFILSAGYGLAVDGTIRIDLRAEFGSTHYLWGNFDDPNARAVYDYLLDGGPVYMPLTSPYGPGATWVELSARLTGIKWLDATVNVRYLSRMTDGSGNSVSLLIPYQSSSTIENAPHVDTWSLGFKAAALPFGFLRISVEPTLYLQENYAAGTQTFWAEVALSAGVFGESVSYIER